MYAKKMIISVGFVAMAFIGANAIDNKEIRTKTEDFLLKKEDVMTLKRVIDIAKKLKTINERYLGLSAKYYKKVEDVNYLIDKIDSAKNNLSTILDKGNITKQEELPVKLQNKKSSQQTTTNGKQIRKRTD